MTLINSTQQPPRLGYVWRATVYFSLLFSCLVVIATAILQDLLVDSDIWWAAGIAGAVAVCATIGDVLRSRRAPKRTTPSD